MNIQRCLVQNAYWQIDDNGRDKRAELAFELRNEIDNGVAYPRCEHCKRPRFGPYQLTVYCECRK